MITEKDLWAAIIADATFPEQDADEMTIDDFANATNASHKAAGERLKTLEKKGALTSRMVHGRNGRSMLAFRPICGQKK